MPFLALAHYCSIHHSPEINAFVPDYNVVLLMYVWRKLVCSIFTLEYETNWAGDFITAN